jgi:CheY-like chemotaxis protein
MSELLLDDAAAPSAAARLTPRSIRARRRTTCCGWVNVRSTSQRIEAGKLGARSRSLFPFAQAMLGERSIALMPGRSRMQRGLHFQRFGRHRRQTWRPVVRRDGDPAHPARSCSTCLVHRDQVSPSSGCVGLRVTDRSGPPASGSRSSRHRTAPQRRAGRPAIVFPSLRAGRRRPHRRAVTAAAGSGWPSARSLAVGDGGRIRRRHARPAGQRASSWRCPWHAWSQTAPSTAQASGRHLQGVARARTLLVEDDPTRRRSDVGPLQGQVHRVVHVGTRSSALAQTAGSRFDMALAFDLDLPGSMGWRWRGNCARRVRAPMLAVTARAEPTRAAARAAVRRLPAQAADRACWRRR